MGRNPCCAKDGLMNRGVWSSQEDQILIDYVKKHGKGNWRTVAQETGLKRCGKSCRLRWLNYLRPDLKRGDISPDEEDLIIRLHNLLGNRWALIAGRLPGRTDNEIKNYWNTKFAKKLHGQTSKSSIKLLKSDEKKPNDEEFEVGIPQVISSTKDVSCNRTFIPPEQNQPTIGNKNLIDKLESPVPLEDASLNFLMDIDVNEVLIPDVLCSDLSLMHENGNMVENSYNMFSSSSNCPVSPYEDLVENEVIERNPLQPTLVLELKRVASFLDLED